VPTPLASEASCGDLLIARQEGAEGSQLRRDPVCAEEDLRRYRQQEASSGGLGAQAVKGSFWTIVFSVLSKVLTVSAQFVLAWLLLPKDFGIVAMATSVICILSPFFTVGYLYNDLFRRSVPFRKTGGQAFWLALLLTTVAAVVGIFLALGAGELFQERGVTGVSVVMALAIPVAGLPLLYTFALLHELRFRTVAAINFGVGLIQTVGSVCLAVLGFGPYALVVPGIIGNLFSVLVARLCAGRIEFGKPDPRSWPGIIVPAFWVLLHSLFVALQMNTASFVIGLHFDSATTGLYYWGWQLALQAISLLAINLQGVFFSTFSKLNADPQRQFLAFQKVCVTLVGTVAPICIVQAVVARPMVELVFSAQWLPAVPVIQALSMGLISLPVQVAASSVLISRGQYRKLALASAALWLGQTCAMIFGSWLGSLDAIGVCVGTFLFFGNLCVGWLGMGAFGKGWKDLAEMLARMSVVVGAAGATGWVIAMESHDYHPIGQIVSVCTAVLLVYLALARLLMPRWLSELAGRFLARASNA
jgi:O-antigen/teichoic acid export membrane protein